MRTPQYGRKETMARHSFIQMSKLSYVKGRISYITSHARQENPYATYRTADNTFWSNLAKESQQEFKLNETKGIFKGKERKDLEIQIQQTERETGQNSRHTESRRLSRCTSFYGNLPQGRTRSGSV